MVAGLRVYSEARKIGPFSNRTGADSRLQQRAQLGVIRTSRVDVQGGGRIAGHPLERTVAPEVYVVRRDRVPVDERLHRQAQRCLIDHAQRTTDIAM